ncbi:MAG: GxxExxY protein [Candidatus Hydrogenedentes bacterium]|nr:GxxExxY protein [Candidatus Hydrogenedentota bacterium]
MEFDKLSNRVIGCALEVHKELGPGLLESTYERCLGWELSLNGIPFKIQHPVPVYYKGEEIECGYRADVIVDEKLIIELKSVADLLPIHDAQLLTYMKLSGLRTGLLMNFNVIRLKDGLKRMVL